MNNVLARLAFAISLLFAIVTYAQNGDLSGRVAFVSLTTAKVVKVGEPLDEFAPRVLLRLSKKGSSSGFLAMTGADGTAFIPIEAGTYCGDAFGLDGHVAKLSARSSEPLHRCFTAVAGRTVEFSVTLAADAKYGGTIPSLAVE
jgi:hypothetical protein